MATMTRIELPARYKVSDKKIRPKNELYELSKQIAETLGTSIERWFKIVSKYAWECERALIDYLEIKKTTKIKSPAGYFMFLVNKHKAAC